MLGKFIRLLFKEDEERQVQRDANEERKLRLLVESYLAQKNHENLRCLESQIADMARRKWGPWTLGFGLLAAFAGLAQLFDFFGANEKLVERATETYVTNHLQQPVIRKVMEETMNQSRGFVQEQLKPLESEFLRMKSEIDASQQSLAAAQNELSHWQEVQKRYVGAKGGNWNDYQWLLQTQTATNEIADLARGAALDIETHFESYRLRDFPRFTFRSQSDQVIELSVEEIVQYLASKDWKLRRSAAFQLRFRKKKSVVGDLIKGLQNETNLFVIAESTRTFLGLTSYEYIGPLDKSALETWWTTNKAPGFSAPYGEFPADHFFVSPEHIKNLTDACNALISAEPEAWKARCLRAICATRRGRFKEADDELRIVESAFPDFGFLWFARAYLNTVQNKTVEAAEAAAKALRLNPDLIMIRDVINIDGTLTHPALGVVR